MDQAVAMQARSSAADKIGQQEGRLEHIELSIGGINCPHCPAAVEKAPIAVAGVHKAQVDLANALASVDFDPMRAKIADLLQAIRSVGYAAGTAKIRIPIKSMHCTSCVTRIDLALQMAPGVVSARASLGTSAVDVEYQPEKAFFETIRKAVTAECCPGCGTVEAAEQTPVSAADPGLCGRLSESRSRSWIPNRVRGCITMKPQLARSLAPQLRAHTSWQRIPSAG